MYLKQLITFVFAILAAFSLATLNAKTPPRTKVKFHKITLFDKYITEGASIGDINDDGHLDIIAGPLWWAGPKFKKSYSYAPVKIYPIKGPGYSAYANNFFTFPLHVTKDKWIDILKIGLPMRGSHLAINPGKLPLPNDNDSVECIHCTAQHHVCNESPQLVNIVGDKQKELLSFSGGNLTLGIPNDQKKPWKRLKINPPTRKFPAAIHGLGAGDINGDGLLDIMENLGWWEQPKDWDMKTPWTFHDYIFAPKQGGAQMYSYDVNGDGKNDVVTGLNAHSYGLAWYEQIKENGKTTFKKHDIMTDKAEDNPYGVCFSQPHAIGCADIDGDGIKDIITGKCFYAHNGRDPGAEEPAVLYWFRTTRHKNGTAELIPYLIDDNSGVGRQITVQDINGDKKPDIVVGNKKGVFLFLQR